MWTLLLTRHGDAPGTTLDRRQIDSGHIKVGRSAATCDWVIADTSGFISREHCTISAIGLELFVVDTSTNGIALNRADQRIMPQQPVAVRVGDRLIVGDYVIEIATEAAGFGASLAPAPPPPAADAASAFPQSDAWFDNGAAEDPIWGARAARADVHEFLGDAMHDFLAPPGGAVPASGPLAFDPFGGGALGEAFSKPLLAAPVEVHEAALAIPVDWAAPPPARPAAPATDPFAMPADPFAGGQDAADPFAASPSFAAGDPFAATPSFGDDDPFAAPVPATPPPERTIPPATRDAAPAGGAEPGWEAFCEGAGLDPADVRRSPESMRRMGVIYRQVVLGLSDLIQDRAAFKSEFRVERTQLGLGRNNPLKHLPPLDTAKLLLGNPLPGFMDAAEAVQTAFEDVKRHQIALLAGVQHALRAVFQRLSPAEVDRLMKKAGAERRGFALRRGVDPWSVYQTMFEALREDATSNVNSVMSVAFREGYEAFLKGA